jgi:MYXO-CTERM domain-containing protein
MRLTKHLSLLLGITTAGLALSSTIGFGSAQAANIQAFENGDVVGLFGSQFDVAPLTSASIRESATGSGRFRANTTANGLALVVLTEGLGGPNSDWLELIYGGNNLGGLGTETITVLWNSDADPSGLPPLLTGVTPQFLVETGAIQDVTALLIASATASGFSFPSNITIQVQSDVDEPVPEPSTLDDFGVALLGLLGLGGMARRRKLDAKNLATARV